MKTSKRIRRRDEDINFQRLYDLSIIKERATAKFDETVEVVFAYAIDLRKGDQNIRGMVSLPQGTGKSIRVAVFVGEDIGVKRLITNPKLGTVTMDVLSAIRAAKKGQVSMGRQARHCP